MSLKSHLLAASLHLGIGTSTVSDGRAVPAINLGFEPVRGYLISGMQLESKASPISLASTIAIYSYGNEWPKAKEVP